MRVFKEDSAHPLRDREQKHVVTKGGGPVGHSESGAFACDHSATADQEQSSNSSEPGEAIQPAFRSHSDSKLTADYRLEKSGERTRLACGRWRPRDRELGSNESPKMKVRCGEGAATSTRGACAPQNKTATSTRPASAILSAQRECSAAVRSNLGFAVRPAEESCRVLARWQAHLVVALLEAERMRCR